VREIGQKELDDIALGAALLGSGGGGDPYIGKLMAHGAIKDCGPVKMLSADEVPDDALVLPIAMMGAPTVLSEKAANGSEYRQLYDMARQYYGKDFFAVMPMEAGGVNSMLPFVAAARLGLPLIDADGMGRAFPELQMVTFTIGGVSATPLALTDEKGNSMMLKTISNKWTEDMARVICMACGGSVSVALYIMDGKTLKSFAVKDIVSRTQMLGEAIRTAKNSADKTPEQAFLQAAEGYKIFTGKIGDVQREVKGGFNFGKVILEGISSDKGRQAEVEFQNENLIARVDGKVKAVTPDLICLVDSETFVPVPTDALKYGKRVMVVALECFPLWRTPEGIALVGPRYFGYDVDYVPVEILNAAEVK
jgi:DUF917 family protein